MPYQIQKCPQKSENPRVQYVYFIFVIITVIPQTVLALEGFSLVF